MALALHLQIDGEYQRAALRRDGALDERLREAAVLHHIELEPERLRGSRRHVLDRADRHGREAEGNAGLLGGAGGEDLAIGILHAGEAGRGERQRQRRRLADDRRRGRAVGNIDHDALAQLQRLEIGAVRLQRLLGIGAAVAIFEEGARHAALRHQSQIVDRSCRLQRHVARLLPVPGRMLVTAESGDWSI